MMKINLDDLAVCNKCGVVLDFTLALKKYETCDYHKPVGYKGKCPVCGNEMLEG